MLQAQALTQGWRKVLAFGYSEARQRIEDDPYRLLSCGRVEGGDLTRDQFAVELDDLVGCKVPSRGAHFRRRSYRNVVGRPHGPCFAGQAARRCALARDTWLPRLSSGLDNGTFIGAQHGLQLRSWRWTADCAGYSTSG